MLRAWNYFCIVRQLPKSVQLVWQQSIFVSVGAGSIEALGLGLGGCSRLPEPRALENVVGQGLPG
jgi:hypothetical protein